MMDLICFSHLRWDFVYQRPQHLLTRASKNYRILYIEEPIWDKEEFQEIQQQEENIYVIRLHLSLDLSEQERIRIQQALLLKAMQELNVKEYLFWFYTPMALPIAESFNPALTIFDCMDELSAFKSAPQSLKENEKRLLEKADIVFTGGFSLYEAKKNSHHNIHAFPSSIDAAHFGQARQPLSIAQDQINIPSPKFGFAGVIDERMDIALLEQVANAKPEWQFIMIGPVVKIDPASLPRLNNIHYLGMKSYKELPNYLSGWDIALIPFALNESTEFISPTKTPEYLAAGLPVISTAIKDVVRPYGEKKLVHIIHTPDEFINAATQELSRSESEKTEWLSGADSFISQNSWDKTWTKMLSLINSKFSEKNKLQQSPSELYVK